MMLTRAVAASLLALFGPTAGGVTVSDLVSDGALWSGKTVTVEGELVGDYQRRGAWTWVQINGDSYAVQPAPEGGELTGANVGVAVRIPTAEFDAAGLSPPGRYGVRGPVVRVTGEWRHRDEGRGGESYVAATTVELVEAERRFEEEMPWAVLIAGLGLLGVAGMIVLASRGRRRAQGRSALRSEQGERAAPRSRRP